MLTIPNIIAYPGRLARLSALAFVLLAVTLLVACSDAQPTQEAPDPTSMPPGSDASTSPPPPQHNCSHGDCHAPRAAGPGGDNHQLCG